MSSSLEDVLHAARSLAKARTFTAVCVVSLGLGMSVVIGIFLLTRLVIGTPPGIDDDGLVELVIRPVGALRAEAGAVIDRWSYPDYLDVGDAAGGMAVTGWSRGEALVCWPQQPAADSVSALYVSSNYFSTVGVTLPRGRGFSPSDDASRAEPEAIIGHRVWQLRFGSDPNVIGRAITINHTQYVIVGVAPERYRGHVSGLNESHYSLWLPLSRHPRLLTAENDRVDRNSAWVSIVGRLSPATSLAQADGTIRSAVAALATRFPATHAERIGAVEPYFPTGARLRSQVLGARMKMLALAGVVLLVVGLNISGMMLVRSAMRERELAIRLAIGAGRWRLARYHLSEALVMAVFGGLFASALLFGVPVVAARAFDFAGPELDLFMPDLLIVLQCIALCFVTSLVLGLLPALRFSRPAILSALKSDSAGSGRRVGRLQRLTAAIQAGLAVPFLVIGGIRVDQARVAAMAELGFQPQGLYAAQLNLSTIGKTEEDRRTFLSTVQKNLAAAQGVASATVGDGLPLDAVYRNARVALEGESTFATVHTTRIGPGYLETVGIRLLAGRTIDVNDRPGAELVVLLSEPLARQLFPAGDPLGKRIVFALSGNERQTYTVVGVTGDLVSTQMSNPRPQLFVSLAQQPASPVVVVARGTPSDPSIRGAFENAIANAKGTSGQAPPQNAGEPDAAFRELITGEGLVRNSHEDILTEGVMSGIAAGVALILAALGVYGVIAFMVAIRTREIGVRVALGASRARVLRDVLGDALRLVVPGVGLGLVLAVFFVRVADPSWYPLGGVEPLVYSFAAATAFAVAALAGIPSARRAAAIQPIIAMRAE